MLYIRTIAAIALSVLVANAQAAIINGDFSATTALSGWSTIGNVTEQPDGVTDDRAILDTTTGSTNFTTINSALNIDIAALTTSSVGGGNSPANASVLYQSFDVLGTGDISFDWNFLTNEPDAIFASPDYAFYVLINALELAQTSNTVGPGLSGFTRQTGFTTETVTGLAAGTYLIGFGVVNVNNTGNDSALLIDNVVLADSGAQPSGSAPIPASIALLGLGLVAMRRRRH